MAKRLGLRKLMMEETHNIFNYGISEQIVTVFSTHKVDFTTRFLLFVRRAEKQQKNDPLQVYAKLESTKAVNNQLHTGNLSLSLLT